MRWPTAWLLALVCVMATGCGPSGHGTRAGEEGPLSPEKVAELENPLRAKPPLEDAKDQYRAAVTQLANAITALVHSYSPPQPVQVSISVRHVRPCRSSRTVSNSSVPPALG